MDYKVKHLEALNLIGVTKSYSNGTEAQQHIADFWQQFFNMQWEQTLVAQSNNQLPGFLGVLLPHDNGRMDYMIAVSTDIEDDSEFETIQLAASKYMVVEAKGAVPKAIQHKMSEIHDYLANNHDISAKHAPFFEFYGEGDTSSDNYTTELWIPIN
ncbi:GyrI-like domain-containing protein [Staphylococcus simiae]|uniref:AraC effector-binding domain-containing protein n=1 Tax=Staphylococcus simiae CCM 7213 = CCUG 51256 TaxID=911238 RepID=G5JFH3_9STAP|nr:GyrI-like domain-containing protein [Staphylococcus simiae]EHJ09066.1 hypothetical protein SS7213T_00926 [Staphylococcus simiae CCM 7213 = CCUG 51256]PNZ14316.1 AraC family transcriptional regulator [Staphylococcus simiae]SNV81275.1 Putative transcriptional activator [Staphylococcus simiae]